MPVQIHESNLLIKRSYQLAGGLALIVVFVVMLIDFVSVVDAMLCLMPVFVAFIVTLD
jgi:predicted RND superfamily exporter protein